MMTMGRFNGTGPQQRRGAGIIILSHQTKMKAFVEAKIALF